MSIVLSRSIFGILVRSLISFLLLLLSSFRRCRSSGLMTQKRERERERVSESGRATTSAAAVVTLTSASVNVQRTRRQEAKGSKGCCWCFPSLLFPSLPPLEGKGFVTIAGGGVVAASASASALASALATAWRPRFRDLLREARHIQNNTIRNKVTQRKKKHRTPNTEHLLC